jgi:DNA-binding CsgD family transcriptional regulator
LCTAIAIQGNDPSRDFARMAASASVRHGGRAARRFGDCRARRQDYRQARTDHHFPTPTESGLPTPAFWTTLRAKDGSACPMRARAMTTGQNGNFWHHLGHIGLAQDIDGLRHSTIAALDEIGFAAAYFLAPVVADPKVGRVLASFGFDPAWEAEYRAGGYALDPLPTIALTRQTAFEWRDGIDRTILSEEQAAYLAGLARFGMERGFAVPCFGPFARHGFVGVGHARSDALYNAENRLKVEACAHVSFQRYVGLVQPYDEVPALSRREMEVLRWIGEGKSNSVIADILQISRSSVDSYVKRLFAKLGVSDRISASLRGLATGLIVSGDYPQEPR